ncbi:MAG: DNA-binding protein WhiA [Thermosediminibacteraceae bacterium]|nr:DNA-binding protein WhiA [Thermosediminibacteraceae bacterium]
MKEELSRISAERDCELAELAAFLRMSGSIQIAGGGNRINIKVNTESASTARRFIQLLKKFVKAEVEIIVTKEKMKKHNLYVVTASSPEMGRFLEKIGILLMNNERFYIKDNIKPELIKKRCCKKAYLRGAFLGSGSISDPKGPYHLEFVTAGSKQAESLVKLINSFGLNAKVAERKGTFVVYLKNGDDIRDLLGLIGANESLLKFENIRVLKEMRNSVNRLVNCETANLNKTVDTAIRQIEMINFLKRSGVFEHLSPSLKLVAEVRLRHPDLSLKELGQMMTPPLGKSGVNHRLKKLEEIAEKIKSMKEED